jgi:AraC-like DNA-binding protein
LGGTVSAKTVRAALGVASAAGIDARALAEKRGVAQALTDVDARFPHAAWIELWQDLARETKDDAVGLHAAERIPFGHWDVIDYLLETSTTLEIGLRRFERYFAIISTGATHTLERHGDEVHLVRRYGDVAPLRLLAPAEFAFAATISHLRIVLGFRFSPREVRFAAPPPASDAEHRRFFGCPVSFGAKESVIVFEAAALTLPMHKPDATLGSILERHADALVQQLDAPDQDFPRRVRRVIVQCLPDGEVSLDAAARRLGTSARTLQRRLKDEGVSFDALLDGTRRDLARRYLGDPALSIQETAHLLAFGDLRGFYRAFKRWEGCTPAEFRRAGVGAPGP